MNNLIFFRLPKIAIFILLNVCLFYVACKKKNPAINNAPIPYGEDIILSEGVFKSFFANNGVPYQSFVINANSYNKISGSKGTLITFASGSLLHQNGTTVTGNVTLLLKEIYSISDMILSNATTTSNGLRLSSGGEIYLQAFQAGEKLQINPLVGVQLEFPINGIPQNDMQLFNGTFEARDSIAQDSILDWDATGDTAIVIADSVWGGGTISNYYSFVQDSFGWSNCDRFWNNTAPGCDVKINVSHSASTQANTSVFMVFDAENTAATADTHDAPNKFGFHSDGYTPLGLSITIIVIVHANDKYYFEIIPSTTVGPTTTVNSTPVEATEAAIAAAINAL